MNFLFLLPGALLAPVIHEITKAVTSTVQGDPTPRNRGFLTFNIFKYVEPVGFAFMLFFGGFGWGQPVPTASLHYKNRRRATVITHLMPILVNLLVGIGAIIVLSRMRGMPLDLFEHARELFLRSFEWDAEMILKMVLFGFAQCNILLALFNLIPVHPMAMSKILPQFMQPDTQVKYNHREKTFQLILILLLVFGFIEILFFPMWERILSAVWAVNGS